MDLGEVCGDSSIPYSLVSNAAEDLEVVGRPSISLTELGKSLNRIKRESSTIQVPINNKYTINHILMKYIHRNEVVHGTYLTILYLQTNRLGFGKDFLNVQFHGEFIYVL